MPKANAMLTVHIGYPKAGSTTLQQNLFAQHSEIINLGLYPTANVGNPSSANKVREQQEFNVPYLKDGRIKSLYSELVQADGIVFDHQKNESLMARNTIRLLC